MGHTVMKIMKFQMLLKMFEKSQNYGSDERIQHWFCGYSKRTKRRNVFEQVAWLTSRWTMFVVDAKAGAFFSLCNLTL